MSNFINWVFQPIVFWSLYLTGCLITFSVLYYAESKGKTSYDIYVPQSWLLMIFAIMAILWPITWIRWVKLDLGYEIVWEDESRIGRFRLWVLKKIKEYRGK